MPRQTSCGEAYSARSTTNWENRRYENPESPTSDSWPKKVNLHWI